MVLGGGYLHMEKRRKKGRYNTHSKHLRKKMSGDGGDNGLF